MKKSENSNLPNELKLASSGRGLQDEKANKPRALKYLPISPPLKNIGWISADDIVRALEVAKLEPIPNSERLSKAAGKIDLAVCRALGFWVAPAKRDRTSVVNELVSIAKLNNRTFRAILKLVPEWEAVDKRARGKQEIARVLAKLLRGAANPVVTALTSAAAGNHAVDAGALNLAKRLIDLEELSLWATNAADQWRIGWDTHVHNDQVPVERNRAELLGRSLIEAWVMLTGRKPSVSRPSPEASGQNEPRGPLVRFLDHLYSCLRHKIACHGGLSNEARRQGWKPSPSTLAKWVRNYNELTENGKASPPHVIGES